MAKSIFLLGSLLLLVSSACAISQNPASQFVYVGCIEDKDSPNTSYAQTLDQVLASINQSAPYKRYNTFNIGSSKQQAITALYQCRGDISMPDCTDCVLEAVSELRQLCFEYFQGIIQMEGCSVRYENSSFIGRQNTDVDLRKCGPAPRSSNDDDLRSRRDKVLDELLNSHQFYRESESDNIQSKAQCTEDLSPDQCQFCVSEAIRITKRECTTEFSYGDIFLSKCFVRYTIDQVHAPSPGISKTGKAILYIMAGLFTVLVLLIILHAYSRSVSAKGNGK